MALRLIAIWQIFYHLHSLVFYLMASRAYPARSKPISCIPINNVMRKSVLERPFIWIITGPFWRILSGCPHHSAWITFIWEFLILALIRRPRCRAQVLIHRSEDGSELDCDEGKIMAIQMPSNNSPLSECDIEVSCNWIPKKWRSHWRWTLEDSLQKGLVFNFNVKPLSIYWLPMTETATETLRGSAACEILKPTVELNVAQNWSWAHTYNYVLNRRMP